MRFLLPAVLYPYQNQSGATAMLKPWVRVLPYFVVEWIAKRYGERFVMTVVKGRQLDHKTITRPFTGVYISIKEDQTNE